VVPAVGFCCLYTSLFSFKGTPYFRFGDQDFFWSYAVRLLSGQVFLRDFHQFTPPGTDLVFAAVFQVFGVSVRTIDWTILWLGMACAVACYFCARAILKPSLAALAGLLSLVLLYCSRLDATHHWFSSLANLLAVLVLLPRRTLPRIAATGCFIALAAFFTQTRGAMGLFACFACFCWERRMGQISWRLLWARTAMLLGIAFAVWLALSWRFIEQAGLVNYWNEQVAYLPKDSFFPSGFLIPHFTWSPHLYASITLLNRLAIYLLLLFVCPWVAFLCLRRHATSQSSGALFLLASLGILQTVEIITMLNWVRMAAVAFPSVILAVWLVDQMGSARRHAIVACWCIVAGLILVEPVATQGRRSSYVDLPTGAVLLRTEDAEEIPWLVHHTRPGDFFFEAANTRLYAPLELENPTPVPLLMAGQSTLPSWVNEVVQGLERSQPRYILWSQPSGIGTVEQLHSASGDHLDPLRIYMQHAYARIQVFANGDEIWERKK
jgi:hypothetical protein